MFTLHVPYSLGEVSELAIARSWSVWKQMHAKGLTGRRAWEERVRFIRSEMNWLKEGRLRVIVRVYAEKPWESETFFYNLTQHGEGKWNFNDER